jgi:hypothetical protein
MVIKRITPRRNEKIPTHVIKHLQGAAFFFFPLGAWPVAWAAVPVNSIMGGGSGGDDDGAIPPPLLYFLLFL